MSAKERKKAWEAFRSEDQQDEGARQLAQLLEADAAKVYSVDDLNDEATLERGLKVTYCLRV